MAKGKFNVQAAISKLMKAPEGRINLALSRFTEEQKNTILEECIRRHAVISEVVEGLIGPNRGPFGRIQ